MENVTRYAVYYAPAAGAFAQRANGWLGFDPATGRALPAPALALRADQIAARAMRYGFHGTIKPPFRLAPGCDAAALKSALAGLAAELPPLSLPGLELRNLEGFLALTPVGDITALQQLAARVVRDLDRFRAPLTRAEIARRNPDLLTPRQRELLDLWGYPYVMEQFRFHLTLTDQLPPPMAEQAAAILTGYLGPVLPRPFEITDLCLFGQQAEGRFHLLHRYALAG